jgi:hypothetical protein
MLKFSADRVLRKITFGYFFSTLLLVFLALPGKSFATGSAIEYLSPACGPVYNGSQISVDIRENSGSNSVDSVQADLTYSSAQFNVISVTPGPTFTTVIQNDTSTPGTTLYGAAILGGGTVSGDQLIATVVFQAKTSSGAATVTFNGTSQVVTGGTGLTTTTTGGYFPQAEAHTCGSLVKASNNPTVYLVDQGSKRPIPSVAIFNSQGLNWNLVTTMTTADQSLPTGNNLDFRDGTVIKGSGPGIYVVDATSGVALKRAVSSMAIFTGLGYTSQDILNTGDNNLPPDGAVLTSTTAHPSGTLVKSGSNIYLTNGSTKQYMGSVYVMYTLGYNSYQIKTATTADLALTDGPSVPLRFGTLIKGFSSPDLYVSDITSGVMTKHKITSIGTFNSLGYNSGQILAMPDSGLPAINASNL